MITITAIVQKIDAVISSIDPYRKYPEFQNVVNRRMNRKPGQLIRDSEILELMAIDIAYSRQAPSDLVEAMLKSGTFGIVFNQFNISKVAAMNANTIRAKYWIIKTQQAVGTSWNQLTVIRQKSKIESIIGCAKKISEIQSKGIGSFYNLIQYYNLPEVLKSNGDINQFWRSFQALRKIINHIEMPFFGRTTSLL
jgi:3-methyladenine DNA glycosylase Tag